MSALIKPRLIPPMLAMVAACVLAGPIVATASASDVSIIQTVNHWSPIVGKDEARINAAEKAFKQHRQARPVIKSLNHEVTDLHHFASSLKAQSASSQAAGTGRDDIASGALTIAGAYTTFAHELQQHPAGLSKQQIAANRRTAKAGHKKIVAGLNLLEHLH